MTGNVTNTSHRAGFLYLIQEEREGLYKIGFSRNIKARMSSMQSGNPYKLVLIFSSRVPDMWHCENLVCRSLARYRTIREWYRLPSVDLYLKAVNESYK